MPLQDDSVPAVGDAVEGVGEFLPGFRGFELFHGAGLRWTSMLH
jgi:hypothetical protein